MKRVLIVAGAVVVLVAAAAGAAMALFPKDFVASELKKQALAATGRTPRGIRFARTEPSLQIWPFRRPRVAPI